MKELTEIRDRAKRGKALLGDVEALLAELDAARAAVGEAWFTCGTTLAEAITRKCRMLEGLSVKDARAACSCCRRCGAVVPCDESILRAGCAGRCFCGVEEGSDAG
jgi:hypothetical protein